MNKLLDISYSYLPFAEVRNLGDFFKSNKLSETSQVKVLHDNLKILFNLPSNKVVLSCAEGERIYKFTILSPGIENSLLGTVIYIPLQKRIDLYTPDSPQMPTIQWKGKKAVFKNYLPIYDRVGFDRLFDRIINSI